MIENILDDFDEFRHDMPEDELREAIANRDDPSKARLALKALCQRRSELAPVVARSILMDKTAAEVLRSTAAVELGRHPDAASEDILLRAMHDATPGLFKHIAKSLGQIGGKEALERLEQVAAPGDNSAGTALRFAKTLISYRLGSDAYLLEPGRNTPALTPATTERTNLEFSQLGEAEFEAALPSVRRQLPAISVDGKSGLRFVCGNSAHWILLNEAVGRAGTAEMLRQRPMVVGAILKYRSCSDQYSLDEYILSNGGGKDRITLIGARPSGIMVHSGFAQVSERLAKFELQSSNPPYSRPIDLLGNFDPIHGRLSFSQVLVGTSWKIAARPSIPKRRALN